MTVYINIDGEYIHALCRSLNKRFASRAVHVAIEKNPWRLQLTYPAPDHDAITGYVMGFCDSEKNREATCE